MSPAAKDGCGGSTAARDWVAALRLAGGRPLATVASAAMPSTSTRDARMTAGRGTRMATPPCHPPLGPWRAEE
eukprot:4997338-Alexandrium_andersonii.AAC.1